jgi:hypothetical protein
MRLSLGDVGEGAGLPLFFRCSMLDDTSAGTGTTTSTRVSISSSISASATTSTTTSTKSDTRTATATAAAAALRKSASFFISSRQRQPGSPGL